MNYHRELFVAKIKWNAIIVKSMCGCRVYLLYRFHIYLSTYIYIHAGRPQLQMNLMNLVLFYAGLLSIKPIWEARYSWWDHEASNMCLRESINSTTTRFGSEFIIPHSTHNWPVRAPGGTHIRTKMQFNSPFIHWYSHSHSTGCQQHLLFIVLLKCVWLY